MNGVNKSYLKKIGDLRYLLFYKIIDTTLDRLKTYKTEVQSEGATGEVEEPVLLSNIPVSPKYLNYENTSLNSYDKQ